MSATAAAAKVLQFPQDAAAKARAYLGACDFRSGIIDRWVPVRFPFVHSIQEYPGTLEVKVAALLHDSEIVTEVLAGPLEAMGSFSNDGYTVDELARFAFWAHCCADTVRYNIRSILQRLRERPVFSEDNDLYMRWVDDIERFIEDMRTSHLRMVADLGSVILEVQPQLLRAFDDAVAGYRVAVVPDPPK